MRILYLTTEFVLPADRGSRVRTLAQLRVLSSLPAVTGIRLFFLREDDAPADREALAREVPKIEVRDPVFHPIHLFRHPRYVPRVVWLRAARGIPYLAGKWDSRAIRERLERELADGTFDVVWLNGLGIAHYLPLVRRWQPRARVVLDGHNVESDRFAQFARRQHGIKRLVAEAESRAALRFERDVLRSVDAVGAISDDDARAYRAFAGIEALTVPQVVAPAYPRERDDDGQRLCWIGNLTWDPNARGLTWFCEQAWPFVRERLPNATFEIAGSGLRTGRSGAPIAPPSWGVPGVTVLGFVDDLGPLYERSTAMAAPLLGGAGIRIKLLEAFRHGLPVVTTPDGAAGLPIIPGREAFVESEAGAFAARVVELLTSRRARARLRDAGYAFVGRHNGLASAQAAVSRLLGADYALAPAAIAER